MRDSNGFSQWAASMLALSLATPPNLLNRQHKQLASLTTHTRNSSRLVELSGCWTTNVALKTSVMCNNDLENLPKKIKAAKRQRDTDWNLDTKRKRASGSCLRCKDLVQQLQIERCLFVFKVRTTKLELLTGVAKTEISLVNCHTAS